MALDFSTEANLWSEYLAFAQLLLVVTNQMAISLFDISFTVILFGEMIPSFAQRIFIDTRVRERDFSIFVYVIRFAQG